MGQVQVRTATRVKEDGAVLSSSFHRHVVVPSVKTDGSWADTDISGEDARVQAVANATWTNSVKTAYQEMIDANSL
jgi:K+-transporting ATPase c subunit